MPFDFKEYQTKCDGMSTEELKKEMENYTRQLSGGATSTATSILLAPYTGGASLLALGLSTPKVHNARKKRAIIEAGLKARGTTHDTRKRDVIGPMAVTGAINTLTLGLAGPIASTVAGQVVGHGVEYATTHVALDAGGSLIEHQHGKLQKIKAEEKLNAQYANFKIQYAHEQVAVQGVQSVQSPVAGSIQGYQPASPLSPTGVNLPGPPPLQYQKYESTAIPASYDTRPQQMVTQQQTNFYAGAAFGFHAHQTSSYQQANVSAQQVSSYQPQQVSSTQQSGTPTGYPAERPLVMSSPSVVATSNSTATTTTTLAHTTAPPFQHRPSLPTPTVTAHTPVHRPSLPTGASITAAPQTPASSVPFWNLVLSSISILINR
jgi:hypothetical protein